MKTIHPKFNLFQKYETPFGYVSTYHHSNEITVKKKYMDLLRPIKYRFSLMKHEYEKSPTTFDLAIYRVGSETITGAMTNYIEETSIEDINAIVEQLHNITFKI